MGRDLSMEVRAIDGRMVTAWKESHGSHLPRFAAQKRCTLPPRSGSAAD